MRTPNQTKWDGRFLQMAQLVSTWSKDPSTQMGCVIANDKHQVVSVGYNGFARGVEDREDRYDNREIKYPLVIHAEVNAILNAGRSVEGCTLYVLGSPCARCASVIVQSGIKEVVQIEDETEFSKRWASEIDLADSVFEEACVEQLVYKRSILND